MTECQVIRCVEDATKVITVSPPDAILLEAVVCDDHDRRIAGGEDYRWNYQDDTIWMGEDLAAAGEYLFEGYGWSDDGSFDPQIPDALRVEIKLRQRGTDKRELVRFTISAREWRRWAHMEARFFATPPEEFESTSQ